MKQDVERGLAIVMPGIAVAGVVGCLIRIAWDARVPLGLDAGASWIVLVPLALLLPALILPAWTLAGDRVPAREAERRNRSVLANDRPGAVSGSGAP